MENDKHDNGRNGTYRNTIKYLGIFGGAQGLSILLNMVRTKITSKLLGASGLSIIALSNRTVQMFSDCTGLSLGLSAVRKMSDAYENCDAAAVEHAVKVIRSIAFLAGLAGVLVMLVALPFISDWVFEDASAYYLPRMMLFSPVVFFMAVSNGEIAILRGTRRLGKVAVYTLLSSLVSLSVAVPLYFIAGIGGVFPAIILTAFLQMCILLYFSLPLYRYRIAPFALRLLCEGLDMIKLGAGYIFASIMTSFAMWLVLAMLSDVGDGTTAGLFSAGFTMVTLLPGVLFAALDSEYYPRLSGVASNRDLCNSIVNEQVEVQLLVQSPLLMLFAVAMPLLVPLLYEGEFAPAVIMAQTAMVGMFMRTMTYPLSFMPLVKNDTMVFVFLEAVYNILFVACIVLGYMSYGFLGVGAGMAVVHLLDFLAVYTVVRCRYGISLSANTMRCFMFLSPLFAVVVVISILWGGGWHYWSAGILCVLCSSGLVAYILLRRIRLSDTLMSVFNKAFTKFKK